MISCEIEPQAQLPILSPNGIELGIMFTLRALKPFGLALPRAALRSAKAIIIVWCICI